MAFRLVASKAMMSQFGRAHGGVIAVEFALVAVPLLAVLLFIVDMAANSITFRQMDVVGRSLATQMRSGSLDLSAHTAQSFRDQIVCPALPTLTCDQLIVSLASPSRLVNLSSADVAGPIWCAGGAGEALVFRLSYPVPFLMRIWAGGFAEQNPRYLVSFGLRNGPQAVAGAC